MASSDPHIRLAASLASKYGLTFPGGPTSAARKTARRLAESRGRSAYEMATAVGAIECPDYVTTDDLNWGHALHAESDASALDLISASFVAQSSEGRALAVKTSVQLSRLERVRRHRLNEPQQYRFRAPAVRSERDYWLQVSARVESDANRFRRQLVCGHTVMIQESRSRGGERRAEVATCENRFCPACCKRIAHKRIERTTSLLQGIDTAGLRFITLTLKHSSAPLRSQIKDLRKAFRKLRRDPYGPWRQTQHWGIAVIEVKRTWRGEWHPHLHIISRGGFLAKRTLSWEWGAATCTCRSRRDPCYASCDGMCAGRSWIVDIGAVSSTSGAVGYVAKYVAKPSMSPALMSDVRAGCELYVAMQRAKTWWLWGDKSLKPKLPPKEIKVAEHVVWDDWRVVHTWQDIVNGLRTGSNVTVDLCESVGIDVASIANWIAGGDQCAIDLPPP